MIKKEVSKNKVSKEVSHVPVRTVSEPKILIKKAIKPKVLGSSSVERILIENFVALQKVMTNLSVSFDSLSTRISKLLDLFESSAKALAEKDFNLDKNTKTEKKIGDKLDNLLDQNKILARGLTLLHEGEPVSQMQPLTPPQNPTTQPPPQNVQTQQPQPPQQPNINPVSSLPQGQQQTKQVDAGEYKKSITSQEETTDAK